MRSIDGVGFEILPDAGDCGPAPQLLWVDIDRLVVDEAYQRPILRQGKRNIAAIRDAFDWRKFAPVIIAPIAGGRYAIVDGQHRVTAALLRGHVTVPCAVIMADRKAQAEAFAAINGCVTQVSALTLYKSRLASGDSEALRIKAVCDAARVEVILYKGSSTRLHPRQTMALQAIKETINRHGDRVATVALEMVAASAGEASGYFRAPIIRAVACVLADHASWMADTGLDGVFKRLDLDAAYRGAVADAQKQRGLAAGDLLQAAILSHCEACFQETCLQQTCLKETPSAIPRSSEGKAAARHPMARVIDRRGSGLAVALGEPAPGRSALDQRRAAEGVS